MVKRFGHVAMTLSIGIAAAVSAGCSAGPASHENGAAAGQASAAPSISARPSRDEAATAMLDRALPADWVGGFDNLRQLSAPENKALSHELLAALPTSKSGDLQEALNQFRYPAYIRPLFRNGKVDTDRLKRYIARVRNLKPTDLEAWKGALTAATGETGSDWRATLGLVQIESFWSDDEATEASRQRASKRLATIPKQAFAEWPPNKEAPFDKATYLMETEALWRGDRFDEELYRTARPLAEEKYKERSSEQERRQKAGSHP